MLFFNIITVNELAIILKLGKTETKIIQSMLNETRNITNNILRVLSQVIEHLFGWAGVDNVNLDVINIDLHEGANSETNTQNSELKINTEDCPEGSQKCSKDNN
jgi:hypothetical protein